MKKITILFTIFILLTSVILIQFAFANTSQNSDVNISDDASEKMYIYEKNLLTTETTKKK